MAHKCGECQLFQGSGTKCGGGQSGRAANLTACNGSFKGPASLFTGKKCGGCRLFQGQNQKCGGGQSGRASNLSACNSSYAPIPG